MELFHPTCITVFFGSQLVSLWNSWSHRLGAPNAGFLSFGIIMFSIIWDYHFFYHYFNQLGKDWRSKFNPHVFSLTKIQIQKTNTVTIDLATQIWCESVTTTRTSQTQTTTQPTTSTTTAFPLQTVTPRCKRENRKSRCLIKAGANSYRIHKVRPCWLEMEL